MIYPISFESHPSSEEIQIICDGYMKNAYLIKGHKALEFFAYFIRDEHNQILGGCHGNTLYGCLYVDGLWVTESLRGKGYGTQLMQSAEKFALEKGCSFLAVNTMDWEALDFYKKLGYYLEFERHGFEKDSILYFLRKNLS